MTTSVEELPDTVLLHIFSYMPAHDLVHSVSAVCSRWATLSSDREAWVGKEYVVGKVTEGDTTDECLALALSHLPFGVRRVILLRPVRHTVLAAVAGSATELLELHARQQMSAQQLESLLRYSPNLTALRLPTVLLKRRDCLAQLLPEAASRLQRLAVAEENPDTTLNLAPLAGSLPQMRELDVRQVTCKLEGLRDLVASVSGLRALSLKCKGQGNNTVLPAVLSVCPRIEKLEADFDGLKTRRALESLIAIAELKFLNDLTLKNVTRADRHRYNRRFRWNKTRPFGVASVEPVTW